MPSPTFLKLIAGKKYILFLFRASYLFVLLFTLVGVWSLYTVNQFSSFFVEAGYTFGKIAILLYILTLAPGITRRFRVQSEVFSFLSVFRRHIGILMYLYVFGHFWILFGSSILVSGLPSFPPPLQVTAGMIANYGLFALFITSNDVATKKLGVWWNRIHTLTYTITWFIFLHVVLIRISVWSLLMGSISLLVLSSHIYSQNQ